MELAHVAALLELALAALLFAHLKSPQPQLADLEDDEPEVELVQVELVQVALAAPLVELLAADEMDALLVQLVELEADHLCGRTSYAGLAQSAQLAEVAELIDQEPFQPPSAAAFQHRSPSQTWLVHHHPSYHHPRCHGKR